MNTPTSQKKVFVSYKREDRPRVKELADNLRLAGHAVWYDESIQVGDHWWDTICQQIEACDVFVFAISQRSLRSVPCQRERKYAAALGKPLLLIRVGALTAIPTEYQLIQFGDFSRGDSRTLIGLIGGINNAPHAPPIHAGIPRPEPPIAPIDEIAATLDTRSDLTFPEQSALLFRLKALLNDTKTRAEAMRLIRVLLKKTEFVQIQEESRAFLPPTRSRIGRRALSLLGMVAILTVIGIGTLVANNNGGSQGTITLSIAPRTTLISATTAVALAATMLPTVTLFPPTATTLPTLTSSVMVTRTTLPSMEPAATLTNAEPLDMSQITDSQDAIGRATDIANQTSIATFLTQTPTVTLTPLQTRTPTLPVPSSAAHRRQYHQLRFR